MMNTSKSSKMASFSSGIMLSRSEAQRQKGDELRMRAAGIDPTKIDEQWLGEVMSKRQKKEVKVDEEMEKLKRLAAELPMEKSEVVSKKPEHRLTWLHKALVLAAKGRIPAPQIYGIGALTNRFNVQGAACGVPVEDGRGAVMGDGGAGAGEMRIRESKRGK
ncbi:Uncharacterized protein SCF082_LOCUS27355 [Durusdinium trenchii]|uniref:Uncharacterized protein n=1 Tax=Durusdinium trenchii TaxID=1381693 RepID=A0ABP0MCY8_9DINO